MNILIGEEVEELAKVIGQETAIRLVREFNSPIAQAIGAMVMICDSADSTCTREENEKVWMLARRVFFDWIL